MSLDLLRMLCPYDCATELHGRASFTVRMAVMLRAVAERRHSLEVGKR